MYSFLRLRSCGVGHNVPNAYYYSTRLFPRRAMLNVPGNDLKKITKATTLDLDTVVLDFEDGVALSQKPEARKLIPNCVKEVNFGRAERCVRINSIASGLQNEDLECLLPVLSHIDSIVIPKVETKEHVEAIHEYLEKNNAQSVVILAAIESARGLLNLREICESSNKLAGLIFASEDYNADLGATRTPEGQEMLFARSTVVTYAAAYGLQAIDMVCIQFKDNDQLLKECIQGYNLGYTGKQAIHPNQLAPIYEHFKPSDDSVSFAQEIVTTWDANQAHGKGVFEVRGKVIDLPMVLWAKKILGKANISLSS
eukprot:TRINITY_DN431_c0_g1_i1.p1 TRINITY_DN431_c0_g1~~TRINITY_DN431_c0_g1_i1.p1  ORF type:complete len:312 (+),score=56.92 TRINITY_DN431_c0_g1_i1:59-994(+)